MMKVFALNLAQTKSYNSKKMMLTILIYGFKLEKNLNSASIKIIVRSLMKYMVPKWGLFLKVKPQICIQDHPRFVRSKIQVITGSLIPRELTLLISPLKWVESKHKTAFCNQSKIQHSTINLANQSKETVPAKTKLYFK